MPELYPPKNPFDGMSPESPAQAPGAVGAPGAPGVPGAPGAPGAPAIPQKPSSTLKSYLDWARMSGQTPTFTNIEGQTGQFATGPSGGAHMMREPGGQPSPVMDPATGMPTMPTPQIPGRGQVQEKESDPSKYTDPWDYADKNSQHILPALWDRMFPGRPYRSELTVSEKKQWGAKAKDQMKVLIEKGKYILKDRAAGDKGKLTLKQRADYLNQFRKEYDEMLTKPPGTDAMTFAMSKLRELEGGLYGQPGETAPAAGPAGATADMPTPQEFRQRIKLLKRKHGGDESKIRQELKAAYPNLPI